MKVWSWKWKARKQTALPPGCYKRFMESFLEYGGCGQAPPLDGVDSCCRGGSRGQGALPVEQSEADAGAGARARTGSRPHSQTSQQQQQEGSERQDLHQTASTVGTQVQLLMRRELTGVAELAHCRTVTLRPLDSHRTVDVSLTVQAHPLHLHRVHQHFRVHIADVRLRVHSPATLGPRIYR